MTKISLTLAFCAVSILSITDAKSVQIESQTANAIQPTQSNKPTAIHINAHESTQDVSQLRVGDIANNQTINKYNNLLDTNSIVKAFTIGIETAAGQGSGVVVGREGNTYTAITARHVLPQFNPKETVEIYSLQTQRYYKVVSASYPAQDKYDIMLLRFKSNDELPLAVINAFYESPKGVGKNTMANFLQRSEDFNVDNDGIRGGGVSMPSKSVTVPIYRKIEAVLLDRARGNKDGYELLYEASTVPGMSGGPIVGWRGACLVQYDYNMGYMANPAYFSLIAIHGRSEGYGAGRSGMSLGVPIDLISDYLKKNATKYGIPAAKSETRDLVNKQYCS